MRTREDGVRQVSNSEMRAFKECRRRWWLAYQLKLRPIRHHIGAASLGNRVHSALAVYYQSPPDEALDRMWLHFDEEAHWDTVRYEEAGEDQKELAKEIKLARAMLEGYIDWLAETGADSDLEVVGVEESLEVSSPYPGVNLVAKMDVRVKRRSDGTRLFVDHKTVQEFTTPLKTIHLDEQMLEYHLIERLAQVDEPCAGAIYSMLRKVGRTKQARPPFYMRHEVYHGDTELTSFYYRVFGVIRDMLAVEAELLAGSSPQMVAYPTPTKDCAWKCEFFSVCPMFDDGSDIDAVLEAGFEVGDPYARYGVSLDQEERSG